jgi:hypothetical protein
MSIVRLVKSPLVHLVTYASPVTRKMLELGELKFYSIPSLPIYWKASVQLRVELGILSGRLYFDYSEYECLLGNLGARSTTDINSEKYKKLAGPKKSLFTAKPLAFMQEWLAILRKGQDFADTPMGFVSQGINLPPTHSFFARSSTKSNQDSFRFRSVHGGEEEEEDASDDNDMGDENLFPVCEDDVDENAAEHVNFDLGSDDEIEHENSTADEDIVD